MKNPFVVFKRCSSAVTWMKTALLLALFAFSSTMYAEQAAVETFTPDVNQRKGQITGVVKDQHGETVIGANILLKGSLQGTISDVDGKFSLNDIPEDGILFVSYIGYDDLEVPVNGRTEFQIVLHESLESLDEVVVVGYGVQKKVNLTGAVSTLKYDKSLSNRPITDPSQALSGKVTGVWASQNSGAPGSDGATIRIRGYGTLNNTDPLVLIDGIEGRMSDISPSDIASITVLKDAASAAIYGSRAANGVVLIESKRGEGEKVSINYNGYVGVQQLGRRYDLISNSAQYMRMWNQSNLNKKGDPLFPDDVVAAFETGNDPYKYPNTNYFDELFRTSLTTQHTVSATVGSKNSSNYLSLSYLDNEGIVKNTSSNRFAITVNNETKVGRFLTLGGRARMVRKVTTQAFTDYDNDFTSGIGRSIYMFSNGHPFTTPYLQDGKTYGGTQALYLSGPKKGEPIVDTRNPFPDLYNGQNLNSFNFMKGNVYARLQLLEGLSLSVNYNLQYTNSNIDNYNTSAACYTDLNGSNPSKPLDYKSVLERARYVQDEVYTTFFTNLNYNRTFNEIHDISLLLGYQQEEMIRRNTSAKTTEPSKETLLEVVSGTKNPFAYGNKFHWRMVSGFGRINYALMGKYLVEMNMRVDASSRFAAGRRSGVFPSFSAAWRLGEEAFIKDLGLFDNLKLRASWGRLGNQNIGSASNSDFFPYLTVVEQNYESSYNFSNALAPGAAIKNLVDPFITWETTTSSDIGVDLAFLRNRLTVEADYFTRNTSGIIVQLPIPTILGNKTSPYENVGEMKNTGFELSVSWSDRNPGTSFSYNIGANVTYVENEVTKFRGGKSPDQLYLIREGYSYKSLYGLKNQGVYQTDQEAAEHMKNNSFIPKAGYLKYEDVNGDGKINYEDFQNLGNTIPKFTFGINGGFNWKNFDFNFQFSGIAGVNAYLRNAWTMPMAVSGGTITKRWENAWTPENPSKEMPMIMMDEPWMTRNESDFWACEMSWLKLKNVQLGYTLPKTMATKMSLQNLYIYVNATDLFTLVSSKYEGFDPERDTFDTGATQYPIPRIFSLGLNLAF